MKIGVVRGSIREGRAGESISRWVLDQARVHGGADFELIDLRFFDLPLFADARLPIATGKRYDNPVVQAWSNAIDNCDGFIIVTPEYNRSVPGAMKNAVDHLADEWVGKPVALIGYGADGAVRAIEHWRQIFSTFEARVISAQLSIDLFSGMDEHGFAPDRCREGELNCLLDALIDTAEVIPVRHRKWRIGHTHGRCSPAARQLGATSAAAEPTRKLTGCRS
ncbi:NADPH-dependent FMN reductase [Propionibacterium australiense]|uniref:NADPH-dependent FMN reductase n=1 Tax=Propionibacterium australiense TaxID=119981 RepID=A0A383S877_9ACTN|nr:NAD(P)H-dependent oxidoreductase [Propionibacterium australiense]RLP09553.1 NADPH-dependent oxidoreductase [Propionibacterium australiense]RLP09870.1 NADPH-dependent oxidoreductase [Propionibacterium australiense]SYZ34200.1 NADPH-dependent FMN reductase [Propionibacterium australiense]VEH89459.1 NADPH azoreductase [Propionibacterium australiense]